MFTGLTEEICRQAWEIVKPSIAKAANAGIINKEAGTIVVLNPHNGEVLFIARVDDGYEDAGKYDVIARAKAVVSWETGLTSRQVQQDAPHLYHPGMTKWGGSAVENKLVVAFSGVQAVFDEGISWMVLNWIISICQNEMTKPDGVMASNNSFIEDPWDHVPGGKHFAVG
jgi:hypothetical protein